MDVIKELWLHKQTSPSGCALGTGSFMRHYTPSAPCRGILGDLTIQFSVYIPRVGGIFQVKSPTICLVISRGIVRDLTHMHTVVY